MTERLLQYIWQLQYYNSNNLVTTEGEVIQVLKPGNLNVNQGPDFLDARIRVNQTTWSGNVELHILSSNWLDHKHSQDPNYNNIILHVVWLNDVDLELSFPVLELQSRVSGLLLARFDDLMKNRSFIPCEPLIHQVDSFTWTAWKERLLVERLQRKSAMIFNFLGENSNHWEEAFWWLNARNFGVPVNSDAFESIARSLPLQLLAKHRNQLHQAEALLFGQAGLLETEFREDYPNMLRKEYQFYKKKYRLVATRVPLHFLRMRPSNFPSVRLAQLAMLVHQRDHLFSSIRETVSLADLRGLLDITANDYWHYHYIFDEPGSFKEKKLGHQMVDGLIINSILPVLFAFGYHNKEARFKELAMRWLQELKPEKNHITNGFAALGITNSNAADSQALIQLKSVYCDGRKCLECSIASRLLKPLV